MVIHMKKATLLFLTLAFSCFLMAAPSIDMPTKEIAKEDVLINKAKDLQNQTAFVSDMKEEKAISSITLNLKEVFFASPIIYGCLLLMSMASVVIWLYSFATFRSKEIMPTRMIKDIKQQLISGNYQDALEQCHDKNNLLSKIIIAGITSRHLGAEFMINTMKSEGKRVTAHLWQRISLLNDIVIIAPMLGLLGTVIGMFYAFYDINRSAESLSALFDGLGIAVGTTVAGLIVAILAMTFSSTLKYRLVKTLGHVENEALSVGNLIQHK